MPEHRRKFSPQFRAEAVQMVISTGRPIAEVARDLGIHDGTLGNWVNAWRREHPEPDQPLSPVERARVKELEDEVARLRMENEFLKKAALDSGGQRNTLGGSYEAEAFAGAVVQPLCELVEVSLGPAAQVGAFGQVLADELVGVLVGAALPGAAGRGEEHVDAGGLGQMAVAG